MFKDRLTQVVKEQCWATKSFCLKDSFLSCLDNNQNIDENIEKDVQLIPVNK